MLSCRPLMNPRVYERLRASIHKKKKKNGLHRRQTRFGFTLLQVSVRYALYTRSPGYHRDIYLRVYTRVSGSAYTLNGLTLYTIWVTA